MASQQGSMPIINAGAPSAPNAGSTMGSLRDWLPDLKEFFLFVVFMFIVIILIMMLHYHLIQRGVQKESRCLREEEKYARGNVYELVGTNKRNIEKYKISYDIDSRKTTVNCACPEGKTVNHFTDIPWYNLRTNKVSKVDDLQCYCDKAYDHPDESTYFRGHPGLIRFYQNNKDTSFFNTDIAKP
jgi:hypothetical protein